MKESISRLDSDEEFELQKNILKFFLEYLYPTETDTLLPSDSISSEVNKNQDSFLQNSLQYNSQVLLLNSENVKENLKSLKIMNTSLYN